MQATAATAVVITDTNVLINFMHIDQVALLGELPAYRVGLPTEVLHELTDVSQRASIEAAIAAGKIHLLVVETMDGSKLTQRSTPRPCSGAPRPLLLLIIRAKLSHGPPAITVTVT